MWNFRSIEFGKEDTEDLATIIKEGFKKPRRKFRNLGSKFGCVINNYLICYAAGRA